jgi:hypothetical protein
MRLFRLPLVYVELLSEGENPDPCSAGESCEDEQVERLYDRHDENDFHVASIEPKTSKSNEIRGDGVFTDHEGKHSAKSLLSSTSSKS